MQRALVSAFLKGQRLGGPRTEERKALFRKANAKARDLRRACGPNLAHFLKLGKAATSVHQAGGNAFRGNARTKRKLGERKAEKVHTRMPSQALVACRDLVSAVLQHKLQQGRAQSAQIEQRVQVAEWCTMQSKFTAERLHFLCAASDVDFTTTPMGSPHVDMDVVQWTPRDPRLPSVC